MPRSASFRFYGSGHRPAYRTLLGSGAGAKPRNNITKHRRDTACHAANHHCRDTACRVPTEEQLQKIFAAPLRVEQLKKRKKSSKINERPEHSEIQHCSAES